LTRDGVVGPRTRAALEAGIVPRPSSRHGHAIEVDKARQLVLVVDDGKVSYVFDTSTGSGAAYSYHGQTGIAVTPSGSFRITRAIDGMRISKLGQLWRPRYFNGGIAIHGNPSVPPYPASHGCVRVTNAAIDLVWARDLAPIGTPVIVR
jgi:lipoprotein-anchoring transpeptidase ErfK/SrfK